MWICHELEVKFTVSAGSVSSSVLLGGRASLPVTQLIANKGNTGLGLLLEGGGTPRTWTRRPGRFGLEALMKHESSTAKERIRSGSETWAREGHPAEYGGWRRDAFWPGPGVGRPRWASFSVKGVS